MNGFEDLLRRDLQTSGLRIAFVVDVDPVVASGHRTIRRRVLTTSALGLVAVVAVVGGLVFRPGAVPPVAEPAPSVVASPSASQTVVATVLANAALSVVSKSTKTGLVLMATGPRC